VNLSNTRKAATLLMSLDSETANELIKELPADKVEELAMELAQIEASGEMTAKDQTKVAREFYKHLQKQESKSSLKGFGVKGFINKMLVGTLGQEKAKQIQSQIKKVTEKKDLFSEIRLASSDELLLALENEHPQTIATVLAELPAKKSQEVLLLLSDDIRGQVVCRMTSQESPGRGVIEKIASMVSSRLKTFDGEVVVEKPGKWEESLRKLAIVLNGLEKELRDKLLEDIKKKNEETCNKIRNLMVTWEDIPDIADRSLQEALRSVDTKILAVALFGADEELVQKIRTNISERVSSTLDEESMLMQEPLPKEVLEARENIVNPLREANEQDKLRFVHRE
jgi:flagellar motor switch protein FliG